MGHVEARSGRSTARGPRPASTGAGPKRDGNPVLTSSGLPLEPRPKGNQVLLVVRSKGQDDSQPAERFLAHPLAEGDPKSVRLVTRPGPDCLWTPYKISAAGYGVSAEWDMFRAGDGPAKDQLLCADDNLVLVLVSPPGRMKRFQLQPIPGKNVVGQMREIIMPRPKTKC